MNSKIRPNFGQKNIFQKFPNIRPYFAFKFIIFSNSLKDLILFFEFEKYLCIKMQ